MASNPPALWTIDDLDGFPDDGNRYELIDGELLVSPPPALPHQLLQSRLVRVLFAGCPPSMEVLFAPVGVERGAHTHVEPDVLVVAKTALGSTKLVELPLLVVEILSPSSRRTDSVRKLRVYEQLGVPSYWIADPDEPSVTVLELGDGRYREIGVGRGGEQLVVSAPFPVTLVPEEWMAE